MKEFIKVTVTIVVFLAISLISFYAGTKHVIDDCHINLYEADDGLLVAIELDGIEYLHFEEE